MVTDNIRILVTGEYWHEDFRGLISSRLATITLCPLERVEGLTGNEPFDLVVIAQSRRGVVAETLVIAIQTNYPTTPKVALLGSWCEGEVRSGIPWPGIPRVYWHQWEGRFEQFLKCLQEDQIHEWQLPATASEADRIEAAVPAIGDDSFAGVVGVSAWTKTQFSMIEDALDAFGVKCCWIERTTWDGEAKSLVQAIVLDDDSLTSNLENRIRWIYSLFGHVPLVLTLGFPRQSDLDALKKLGVGAIVSKPFKLGDLKQALLAASDGPVVDRGPIESF